MQTSLETLTNLERRLTVSVPQQDIDREVDNRLKRLAMTAKMDGFRPGKVPFKVVVQQYGLKVRQEVMGDTLQKTFAQAVQQQNLRVAGYPRFEPKAGDPAPGNFEFSATFEVFPEVALGDLSQASIERPVLEVDEADVDRTVEILRKQRVRFEKADRPGASGDRITLDYNGTIDGQDFQGNQASDLPVVLGEGRLLPDFEGALNGMSAGEAKSFELTFPADYHGAEVAGKTARFEVTVKEVAGPVLPAVDADFAKGLGVEDGDLATMRSEVRSNLQREVRRRMQTRIKEQVMQALLDTTKIDVPKGLVEGESQRMAQAMMQDMKAQGAGGQIQPALFEEGARRRVALGLILSEMVKAHNLHARPEQVRAIVEDFAQSYEHPHEVVTWYYSAPERLNEAESLALEENVVAWVMEKARVTDKAVAFEEFMGK